MNRIYKSFNKLGPRKFVGKLLSRTITNSFALPIAIIIWTISPIYKLKLIGLYSHRIGHFGMNTHLLLCALESNQFHEEKKYKHFFYINPNYPLCNTQLLKMFKRVITVLPFAHLCQQVDRFLVVLLRKEYNSFFKQTFESSIGWYDFWGLHKKIKRSYLDFTENETLQAKTLLHKLGIPNKQNLYVFLVEIQNI